MFLEKHSSWTGAAAIAALLVAGMTWSGSGTAIAAGDELLVTLVAVDEAPEIDGVQPTLILSGFGSFTADSVGDVGGGYTYLDGATDVPKTVLSAGTWTATEVLGWTPAEGEATYGRITPGFVDLRVDLTQDDGPVIEGATLRINCNVGFAGIVNKDPDSDGTLAEGYWLTIPDGAAFGPTTGLGQFVPKDPIIGVTEIRR